jgi:hypothetical protein
VVWVASAFLGVFGTQIPKLSFSRGAWIAIFLAVTALFLLRAAYRLHVEAHPDFPLHFFTPGPLWIFDNPEPVNKFEEKLIAFDVEFLNRDPTNKFHLTVDLWWVHESKVQPKRRRFWFDSKKARPLGPYKLSPYRGSLGTAKVFGRPQVIDGQESEDGLVAFVPHVIPGMKIVDDELKGEEGLRFFVRLSDGVSGAERDVDMNLPGGQP